MSHQEKPSSFQAMSATMFMVIVMLSDTGALVAGSRTDGCVSIATRELLMILTSLPIMVVTLSVPKSMKECSIQHF